MLLLKFLGKIDRKVVLILMLIVFVRSRQVTAKSSEKDPLDKVESRSENSKNKTESKDDDLDTSSGHYMPHYHHGRHHGGGHHGHHAYGHYGYGHHNKGKNQFYLI